MPAASRDQLGTGPRHRSYEELRVQEEREEEEVQEFLPQAADADVLNPHCSVACQERGVGNSEPT